jgi:hypothetical protein
MPRRTTVIRSTALAASTLLTLACNAPDYPTTSLAPRASSRDRESAPGHDIGFSPFAGVLASNVCTVDGGDPVNPLVLPAGFKQTIIASEPAFADAIDMNTENETGPDAGRYLYRPSEGAISEVSVTDLLTGVTKRLAFRPDWESFDASAWTPWGTLLVGEEASIQQKPDPDFPNAKGGLMYEIFLTPGDPTTAQKIVARPALGAKAHEGTRIDKRGYVYGISENNPGFIFRFIPDTHGDLSSGRLFALKITNPTGDRTGDAEWLPLDRAAVRIDANAAAAAAGATGYNRPEDIEIGTSSGTSVEGNDVLYVALTGTSGPTDNRIIAIELNEPNGGSDHATAFVWDYVRVGLNATAEFEMPDNLALDHDGNLFIAEDPGGSFAGGKRKGDDIWLATPGVGKHAPAALVTRFASLTDCTAEPTGLYVDLRRNRLFVNVQHRGGDGHDLAMGIERIK